MSLSIPAHLEALSAIERNMESAGLRPVHLRILALLCANDFVNLTSISEVMGNSMPVTSRHTAALIKGKYVERRHFPEDLRVIELRATKRGRELDARIQRQLIAAPIDASQAA